MTELLWNHSYSLLKDKGGKHFQWAVNEKDFVMTLETTERAFQLQTTKVEVELKTQRVKSFSEKSMCIFRKIERDISITVIYAILNQNLD